MYYLSNDLYFLLFITTLPRVASSKRGRAQAIRYLFEDQGIKYKDISVDPWEKWQTVYKPAAPFGLCPFMSDGDFQLAESNAILRYLGRKHGLHPTDVKDSARVDMINDNLEDIRKQYSDVIYSENHAADQEAFDSTLPGLLMKLEICFADYNMFDLLDVLQIHMPGCLDKYQSLKEYHTRVAARPGIKKYRETAKFKDWKINYNDYV